MAVTMKTTVTQGDQSKADNTTKVTVKTSVTSSGGSWNHNNPSGTYKIYKNSISGKVLASGTFSHSFDANVTTQIFKKDFTLEHDSDGTLDIVVVITFATGVNAGTLTNTEEKTLSTIQRESTVTAISCDIGESTIITINRNDDSFTHTLQYKYPNDEEYTTIISKTKRTSYGWKVPTEAYKRCPNAKYVTITIRCFTYSGSKRLGSDTCTFKAYANEDDCEPEFSSFSVVADADENSHPYKLTLDHSKVIKGVSSLSYSISVTPQHSADRKSISVVNGSQKLATYDGVFKKATSATVKATAIDTRGYDNSDERELTLIDYGGLSISASVKWLTFADGGSKIEVTLSGKYSDINFGTKENPKNNQLTLIYKCVPKALYDEDSQNLSISPYAAIPEGTVIDIEDGKFTTTFEITQTTPAKRLLNDDTTEDVPVEALDYQEAYSFRFAAIDLVFDSSDDGDYKHKLVTKHLASALPIFDWGKNDFNFNVPVYYKGKKIISDSGWANLDLASGFGCFDGKSENHPQYKSFCGVVSVRGILTVVGSDITTSKNYITIASGIPKECRPSKDVKTLCQGSGSNKWLCTITTGGEIQLSRYGTTEYGTMAKDTWLPFNVTYLL